MQTIRAMMRKEFLQVFRTREMIMLLVVLPLIQLIVLGYAITTEVKHLKLVVLDQDNSQISRQLIHAFRHTDRFDFKGYVASEEDVGDYLRRWEAQIAIIIPVHFQRDLRAGKAPAVQLVLDGIDGNAAGIAGGYAAGILKEFVATIAPDLPLQVKKRLRGSVGQVTLRERMWYNLNLDNAFFMIPGLVVVLLTIVPMMLTAMSLVREKEIGTLEQLMVTPLKKHQLLLGKILPFLILTFLEMGGILLVGQWMFQVPMKGSYVLLGLFAFVYLFTTLGLGMFISTITQTQQQAMFASWFVMVFAILMSGFFIPIENMPAALQQLTYLNPMRYIMSAFRDVFQKGSSLWYLREDLIRLTLFGTVIFTAGVLKFHKRLD